MILKIFRFSFHALVGLIFFNAGCGTPTFCCGSALGPVDSLLWVASVTGCLLLFAACPVKFYFFLRLGFGSGRYFAAGLVDFYFFTAGRVEFYFLAVGPVVFYISSASSELGLKQLDIYILLRVWISFGFS